MHNHNPNLTDLYFYFSAFSAQQQQCESHMKIYKYHNITILCLPLHKFIFISGFFLFVHHDITEILLRLKHNNNQ